MNKTKAEFFDSQVDEPWASSAFGPAEMRTIDRMLETSRTPRRNARAWNPDAAPDV